MYRIASLIVILVLVTFSMPTKAESFAEMQKNMEDMRKLLEGQRLRIDELESQVAKNNRQQISREETLKIIKEMTADASTQGNLPKWMKDLKFYGDLRLRYEGIDRNYSNRNRNRARFRLRFGMKKYWWEKQMQVVFRLATGDPSSSYDDRSSQTSTNQTFDIGFSEKNIWVDRAYAKYKPNWLKGFAIMGGKFGTPFVHTNMIWDSDVNPEGFWAMYKRKVPNCESLEGFASVGYFIVEEEAGPTNDTTMWGYQLGANWKITKDVKWTIAATYYDWDHFETGFRSAGGNTTAGGRLTAEEFNVFNLLNKVSWKAFGLPMSVTFDWAQNLDNEVATRQFGNSSDAYAVFFKVGKNKKKGDWSAGVKYAYIEPNAVPGQYNDADFGSSDSKGFKWGAKYNIDDFLTAAVGVFWVQPVSASSENETDTIVQADLIWKF